MLRRTDLDEHAGSTQRAARGSRGGGENPAGYHVLNLLLHWVNAVLVYCLALAVLTDARAAFFTAALFTTHPIATEAVTNIIGRADLLATLAVLGGTLLYLRSRL